MTLRLYMHPLSSYCWKTLIALYEADVPFEQEIVDLQDPDARERFVRMTPLGKFPVIVDEAAGKAFPESTIVIEYLATKYPGAAKLLPADWQQRVLALQSALGITRKVLVRLGEDIASPFTARLLRPVIWLPLSLITRMPRL